MKKLTIIELAVVFFVLAAFAVILLPYLLNSNDEKVMAQIKASNAIFTSKIIEEFASSKEAKPSEVAKRVADELNKTEKNPYSKAEDLYVFNKDCVACSAIECDDNLKMVIITTVDKKGLLVARTVIKPPSFVTYYKEEKEK